MQFHEKNFLIYLISRVFCLDFFKFSGPLCKLCLVKIRRMFSIKRINLGGSEILARKSAIGNPGGASSLAYKQSTIKLIGSVGVSSQSPIFKSGGSLRGIALNCGK